MSDIVPNDYDEREVRLNAMQKNMEWLKNNDWGENQNEAAKRLGLIKGDLKALWYDAFGMEGYNE